MLINKSIKQFINELASEKPAPGGGSASAMTSAMAAALVLMTINITFPKITDETAKEKLLSAKKELDFVKKVLTSLIDKDADAYNRVVKSFKLPKNTEKKKEKRQNEIQKSFTIAASVPLQTALQSFQIIDILKRIKDLLSKNVASDIEVAELLANAGLKGAIANVKINLDCIKDEEFKKKTEEILKIITPF